MSRSSRLIAVLLLGFSVSAPAMASAQGFISPFLGFDYGGDSGCQDVAECDDKNSNIGVGFGTLGAMFGVEAELGYARAFFGETAGTASNVLTFMTNVIVGPRIGPVRPYVEAGVGLIKTRVEFSVPSLLETTNNSFGWDFGGGVMVMFGEHVGVRGDLRRFATFQDRTILGIPLSNEKLDFQRAAAAVVLAF